MLPQQQPRKRCRGGKWNPSWLSPRTWARRLEMLKSTDVALGTDSGCLVLYWGTTEGECGERMIKQTDNATFPTCVSLISAWKPSKNQGIIEVKPFLVDDLFLSGMWDSAERTLTFISLKKGITGNITYWPFLLVAEHQTEAWHLKQLSVLWSLRSMLCKCWIR